MLYNYKSKDYIQDVILDDYKTLIDDIVDEHSTLHRNQSLYIYAPSSVAKNIIEILIEDIEEFFIDDESETHLLFIGENDVLITLHYNGMIFIEEARGKKGDFKHSDETGALNYIYDGFKKTDIDNLALKEDNILVFGFEDEDYSNCDDCCKCCKCCECQDKDDKELITTTKEEYRINGKSVTKDEYMKKLDELDDMYLDGIRDMLLNYCTFMDEMNEWKSRLLRW